MNIDYAVNVRKSVFRVLCMETQYIITAHAAVIFYEKLIFVISVASSSQDHVDSNVTSCSCETNYEIVIDNNFLAVNTLRDDRHITEKMKYTVSMTMKLFYFFCSMLAFF